MSGEPMYRASVVERAKRLAFDLPCTCPREWDGRKGLPVCPACKLRELLRTARPVESAPVPF